MTTTPAATDDSAGFRRTRWSLVRRARAPGPAGRAALDELCTAYWPAVYALFRRHGEPADAAADLTQSLFGDLLARGDLESLAPGHGRFRAFLRVCARNALLNAKDRERAQKRGGGAQPVSLDAADEEQSGRYVEVADARTPQAAFERRWAIAVIDRAYERFAEQETARGRGALLVALRPVLAGEPLPKTYAELAADLGMTAVALKVAAHRLRRRFREALLDEVGETLQDPADAADELHQLWAALRGE